ncbi:MAG: hypothetical protein ABFS45_24040 [Pseudomonadota bacterium]
MTNNMLPSLVATEAFESPRIGDLRPQALVAVFLWCDLPEIENPATRSNEATLRRQQNRAVVGALGLWVLGRGAS